MSAYQDDTCRLMEFDASGHSQVNVSVAVSKRYRSGFDVVQAVRYERLRIPGQSAGRPQLRENTHGTAQIRRSGLSRLPSAASKSP
jgi:hypothetical protein